MRGTFDQEHQFNEDIRNMGKDNEKSMKPASKVDAEAGSFGRILAVGIAVVMTLLIIGSKLSS